MSNAHISANVHLSIFIYLPHEDCPVSPFVWIPFKHGSHILSPAITLKWSSGHGSHVPRSLTFIWWPDGHSQTIGIYLDARVRARSHRKKGTGKRTFSLTFEIISLMSFAFTSAFAFAWCGRWIFFSDLLVLKNRNKAPSDIHKQQ